MIIRRIEDRDIPRLRELQNGFDWPLDDTFVVGLVVVDENDNPVVFGGAWRLAEVHAVMDPNWSTPGARLLALKQLNDAMAPVLSYGGFRESVTWFDGVKDRFRKRMERWGWVESEKRSWHRGIK